MADFNSNLASITQTIYRQTNPDDAIERAEILLDRVLWEDTATDAAIRKIISTHDPNANDLIRFIITFTKRYADTCIGTAGPDATPPPADIPPEDVPKLDDYRHSFIAVAAATMTGAQSLIIAIADDPNIAAAAVAHADAIDYQPVDRAVIAVLPPQEASEQVQRFLDSNHPKADQTERDRERHSWTQSIADKNWTGIAIDAACQEAEHHVHAALQGPPLFSPDERTTIDEENAQDIPERCHIAAMIWGLMIHTEGITTTQTRPVNVESSPRSVE